MTRTQGSGFLGLAGAGVTLMLAAAGAVPAAAQALLAPSSPQVAAPGTTSMFWLRPGQPTTQLGQFAQPRQIEVCVRSWNTPAWKNVGARASPSIGDLNCDRGVRWVRPRSPSST